MVDTLPEVDWGGVGSSQEAGQEGSCSISSWRHRHPTPAEASPILLVSPTLQAGLPVQCPSQSQAELWFISAAPAASLSLLVNRGSRQGRVGGGGGGGGSCSGPCLASGLFWSLFQSSFPENWGLGYLPERL